MSKSDNPVIDVPYRPSSAARPIETFTLSSLRLRRGRDELTSWQRPQFELLVWCTAGAGRHEIDFAEVDLAPGRLVHVRAGQVHRWLLDEPYEAQLILLHELHERSARGSEHLVIDVDPQLEQDLHQILGLVSRAEGAEPLSLRSLGALRDLIVSILNLDQPVGRDRNGREALYDDFIRLLERVESLPRTVHDCAWALGCSTRTLARVCVGVAGVSPKVLLDQAVALEAQRRLSIGEPSVAQVAESLGFVELSNFTRFFRRITGETPSSFLRGIADQ